MTFKVKYSAVKSIPDSGFLIRDTDKSLLDEDLQRLYIESKPVFPSFIKSDVTLSMPVPSLPNDGAASPFGTYGAPPPNLTGDVIMPPDQETGAYDTRLKG